MADKPLIASIDYNTLVRLVVLELVAQRGENLEAATNAVEGMNLIALKNWAKDLGHPDIQLIPNGYLRHVSKCSST